MQDSTSPQPVTPTPDPIKPPKKNIGQIVRIIIGLICLIAMGAYLVNSLFLGNDPSKKTSSNDTTSSQQNDDEKLREANAVTATSMAKLGTPCQVGSVTNAAAFAKPYKVAAFSKTSIDRSWSNVSLDSTADYSVKLSDYEQVNVVVCLEEKEDATVKSSVCDFKSGDKVTSIDYYATKYDATAYEAKSGKKIKELGEVSAPAPASRCPIFTMYDKNDPKLIAKPDSDTLNALVAKFVSE